MILLFDQLTDDLIKWAALCTHRAAGPSGLDAYTWRRLATLILEQSNDFSIPS